MGENEERVVSDGFDKGPIETGKPRKPRTAAQQQAFEKAREARQRQLEELRKLPKKERMTVTKMTQSLLERVNQLSNKIEQDQSVRKQSGQKESDMPRQYYDDQEPVDYEDTENMEAEETDDNEEEEPPKPVARAPPKPKPVPPRRPPAPQTVPRQAVPPRMVAPLQRKRRAPVVVPEEEYEADDQDPYEYEEMEATNGGQSSYHRMRQNPQAYAAVQPRNPMQPPARRPYTNAQNQLQRFQAWLDMA